MNQPEHELARQVVRHLNYGVDNLDPAVRDRLAAARRTALAHYRAQPTAVFGLAWAGRLAGRLSDHHVFNARVLVVAAALLVATAGVAYWQGRGPASELADIDFNLLTDELPINAYLDKGFDSWLKRSSR